MKRDTPADYWDKLAEFVARVDHVDKINSSYAGEPRIEQAIKELSEASKGVQEVYSMCLLPRQSAQATQRLSIKPEEKTQIMKRDSEIARLREQRDAARNELGDRKQKEVHRLNHNESMKASYESRGVSYVLQTLSSYPDVSKSRLSALESQLNRYKARLTAEAGHPDLLEFLVGSNPDVVVDLKKRLR